MAGEQTLGKLVVRLLMDNKEFDKGAKKAVSSIDSVNAKFTGLAGRMDKMVVGAFKAATASIVAFGTASVYVGAKFQQSITTVGAIAGSTKGELKKLEDQARKLGSTTAFSATQTAVAMQDLARAGLSTDEIIGTSEAALLLAGSVGAELSSATSLMASTMAQFGMDASQSGRMADVFSTAMRTTLFDMGSLTEAMKYAGVVGKGFTYNLEETTAAVAMFRNIGLQGSQAGTSFRMAMASASKVTSQAAAVLKKYKLEAQDINPEMNSFAEIMETLGEAGITTADALTVFGSRAGANVKLIADQFADGSTKFHTVLDDLENSAGSTEVMYGQMMDTVQGQWQILRSAMEELMISTFDRFALPLKNVLTALGETVAFVAQQFNKGAESTAKGIENTAEAFTKWLRNNQTQIANAFLAVFQIVNKLLRNLPQIVEKLYAIGKAVLYIYAAVKSLQVVVLISNVIAALAKIPAALAAVRVGITLLQAKITAATGGLYAIVAVIGTLVAGLISLAGAYGQAAREAAALQRVEEQVGHTADSVMKQHNETAKATLANSQLAVQARRAELAETDKLSRAKEEEADIIRDLTQKEAGLALQRGELIEFEGQLRTVKSLYEDMGDEAYPAMLAQYDKHMEKSEELRQQLNHELNLYKATKRALEEDPGDRTLGQRKAIARMEDKWTSMEVWKKWIDGVRELTRVGAEGARQIGSDWEDAVTNAALRAVREQERIEEAAENKRKQRAEAAKKEREAEAKRIIQEKESLQEELDALADKAQDDVELIGKTDLETKIILFEREVNEVKEKYDLLMGLHEGNKNKQKELEEEFMRWWSNRQEVFDAERAEEEAERLKKESDEKRDAAQKDAEVDAEIQASNRDQTFQDFADWEKAKANLSLKNARTTNQKIRALKEVLQIKIAANRAKSEELSARHEAGLSGLTDAEYLRAQKELSEQRVSLEKDTQSKISDLRKEQIQKVVEGFKKIAAGAKAVAENVKSVFDSVVDGIMKGVDSFMKITGISFDLLGAVGQLTQDQESAREEGEAFDSQQAARDLASGVLTGGMDFLAMLVESAPIMIEEFINGLPALMDAVAEAIPMLAETFATQIPVLITAIVEKVPELLSAIAASMPIIIEGITESIGPLVDAVVDSVPLVVNALSENLPALIDTLIQELPRVIAVIVEALPDLIDMIVNAVVRLIEELPAIIEMIIAAVPDLIVSLIEGIDDIIMAVFEAIPLIIEKVIAELPNIISALIQSLIPLFEHIVAALPELIVAIIELIPELILAFGEALPELITAIISMIPRILYTFAEALPDLIPAIVNLIPNVILAIIKALPEIIWALVDGILFELLPQLPIIAFELVKGIIEGLWNAMGDLIDILLEAFQAIGEFLADVIKKALSSGGLDDEGSWGILGDAFDYTLGKHGVLGLLGVYGSEGAYGTGGLSNLWSYDGADYIAATQRVTVHPGEAIIPADGGYRGAVRGGGSGDAINPPGGGYMPFGGGGGTSTVNLAVMLNDRVLDEALIGGLQQGHTPKIEKRLQKVSGTVKGYNRGKHNSWG